MANEHSLNNSLNNLHHDNTLAKVATKPENYSVSVNVWHHRYAHMYTKGLNYLANDKNVKGIDFHGKKVKNDICENCEISKSTRAGFQSESRLLSSKPLELLHMDLWGPCRTPSFSGAHYLYCIVDDCTRYTWVFPLTSKDQVQRQSGATAGQWDVYFYPPGQQVKLRSRPEVRSYCENELNEPYVAADYDWKPSQKPVDTVVQEPSTEQAVNEPQGATDESDNNGTSEDSYETFAVRVYLAEISEPNTYEEALASPQKAEWVAAMREELDTLEEQCGNCVNFWPQPGQRLPPDKLGFPIENPKLGMVHFSTFWSFTLGPFHCADHFRPLPPQDLKNMPQEHFTGAILAEPGQEGEGPGQIVVSG
uniref:GAG-pre-integrase domain-containing protein n=1 Tax=Strigamia maritima TaxID=126957 RepID=T1IHU3_STRMM